MAGYRGGGGGGGGASVVPATIVVAAARGDYPLTDAGIRAAITALIAAGGGTLYIGQDGGTPVDILTDLPEITVPIKIVGAGRNATRLNLAADVKLFHINDVYASFEDFTILGDNGVSDQVIWTFTAPSADFFTQCAVSRVNANTSPFGVTTQRVRTIFDFNSFSRYLVVRDSYYGVGSTGATDSFLFKDTAGRVECDFVWATVGAGISGAASYSIRDCLFFAQLANAGITFASVYFENSSTLGDVTIGTGGTFIGASIGSTWSFSGGGGVSSFYNCTIGDVSIIGHVAIIASNLFNTVTLEGAGIKVVSGCFTATSCTLTITDVDGAVIQGFPGITVEETGTSDNNYYTKIASDSTIIGANSVVADAQNEELEVAYSNATSSTYSTSGVRYLPLAKVANPNEEYAQFQFQARRSGRVRLYIDYAMSVDNGGDLQLDYSGAAIQDGDDPDAALGALLSETFTPGAGATRKTRVVDTTLDVVPGDDVVLQVLRDDAAGDTHTGTMNLISVKAVVW